MGLCASGHFAEAYSQAFGCHRMGVGHARHARVPLEQVMAVPDEACLLQLMKHTGSDFRSDVRSPGSRGFGEFNDRTAPAEGPIVGSLDAETNSRLPAPQPKVAVRAKLILAVRL